MLDGNVSIAHNWYIATKEIEMFDQLIKQLAPVKQQTHNGQADFIYRIFLKLLPQHEHMPYKEFFELVKQELATRGSLSANSAQAYYAYCTRRCRIESPALIVHLDAKHAEHKRKSGLDRTLCSRNNKRIAIKE